MCAKILLTSWNLLNCVFVSMEFMSSEAYHGVHFAVCYFHISMSDILLYPICKIRKYVKITVLVWSVYWIDVIKISLEEVNFLNCHIHIHTVLYMLLPYLLCL